MKDTSKAILPILLALFSVSTVNADSRGDGRGDSTRWDRGGKYYERKADHDYSLNRSRYYRPGYRVDRLPDRHHHFVHRNRDYYYFGGNFFYRPHGYYEVIRPPVGVRVPYLAPGYVSFYIGPSRYFYVNYTYYRWDDRYKDYVVVREPRGASDAVVAAATQSVSEIYAYPARGQSAEQQDRDYYDCHVWSVGQSGYDPSLEEQNNYKSKDYRRAMTACLEGRGYSVR